MAPVTSETDFLAWHGEKTVVASSSRRRCRAILCLDGFRLDLSGWRWNQGFPSYFSGGTGGTQAANQATKWSSFPYLSTFQAGRQHFYIFFLPDRFTYFQHRIPIGFILFAFSRSRPKKISSSRRRHGVRHGFRQRRRRSFYQIIAFAASSIISFISHADHRHSIVHSKKPKEKVCVLPPCRLRFFGIACVSTSFSNFFVEFCRLLAAFLPPVSGGKRMVAGTTGGVSGGVFC